MDGLSRLLFVVSRRDGQRQRYLERAFDNEADVEIVVDRRRCERRQQHAVVPVERRRGHRRSSDVSKDLRLLGWALVKRQDS